MLEESFIAGTYHHLNHTSHMLWDRVLNMLEEVHTDIEKNQYKFQVRKGAGHMHNPLAGRCVLAVALRPLAPSTLACSAAEFVWLSAL